jgi:hypothetical protein
MDSALRALERSLQEARDDVALRTSYLTALARAEKLEAGWREAHERGESWLADLIFEAAGAPFTLEVTEWPHPSDRPTTTHLRGVGWPIFVGRHRSADFVVPSPWVPARNCTIVHGGGERFVLQDLASHNGTWKDGRRITEAALEDGERFSPASPEIVVRFALGWEGAPWPKELRLPASDA